MLFFILSLWVLVEGHGGGGSEHKPWRFGAFIDGGSEGSRIYVLRWRPTATPGSEIICPEVVGDSSVIPGVASFALRPHDVGASLKPLLQYAMKLLHSEKDDWAKIPVYLRATAGMRLLFPDERESILEHVRSYFRTLPFHFRDEMASVATGEEEGVFGWISANYLMGNLKPDEVPTSQTTIGSLDLGGASTQIVFMPQKSTIQHAFPLHLGPHRVQLYSYSFLHFGQREAAHRTASVVISDALLSVQSEATIAHPCFSKGYIYTPMFSYSGESFAPIQVRMNGTSDFNGCESLVKRIFNKDAPCLIEKCSFYGVYQPRVYEVPFLAFVPWWQHVAAMQNLYGTCASDDSLSASHHFVTLCGNRAVQGERWRTMENYGEILKLSIWHRFQRAFLFLVFPGLTQHGAVPSEQAHFADVVADLGLPVDAQLEDIRIATRYVCSLTLVQLEMLFARVADEYDRTHLCFHATFAYTLLHFGYELQANQIMFKTSSGGKPIDWAIGAMIYEINQDPLLSAPLPVVHNGSLRVV